MAKSQITGKIGNVPPPHAPRETSQPLTSQELERQMAAARAHEQVLPPFAPDPAAQIQLPPGVTPGDGDAVAQLHAWTAAGRPADWRPETIRAAARERSAAVTASIPPVPRETGADAPSEGVSEENRPILAENPPETAMSASDLSADGPIDVPLQRPDAVELTGESAVAAVADAFKAIAEARSAPQRPDPAADGAAASPGGPAPPLEKYQPAASNTESPARGIPQPIADTGKQITGGFGVSAAAAAAEYVPLDGSELCLVMQGLLMQVAERLSNDLRFSIAVTYPRVRARVELIVESYMADSDFRIVRHLLDENRAPVEIARQHADEVCFVLVNQRQEVDAQGRAESPANAIRQELGVEIPYKQAVETPAGRIVVDRRG